MRLRFALLVLAPWFAAGAWAHDVSRIAASTVPPDPHLSFDPWTGVPLVVSALLYGWGVIRLWRRARRGGGISYVQLL